MIISVFQKSFSKTDYFDSLRNEALSDPSLIKAKQDFIDCFQFHPVIGKAGDLLLLSYGALSYNYIWGINGDKVVFKITTSGKDIFDAAGKKIGETNLEIQSVILPHL